MVRIGLNPLQWQASGRDEPLLIDFRVIVRGIVLLLDHDSVSIESNIDALLTYVHVHRLCRLSVISLVDSRQAARQTLFLFSAEATADAGPTVPALLLRRTTAGGGKASRQQRVSNNVSPSTHGLSLLGKPTLSLRS